MEVTRSDIQTRPYDQPQPPQCEHAAFVKMPFPDPETSHLLEEIWSSRNPSLPPWCEYPSHDVSRPVETPLLEPKNTNTSSYSTQPEAATHDIVPIPTQSSQHILACFFEGWPIQFFIRLDHGGSFHTYPRLGGPFQSLQEAEDAIDRHLDHLRAPIMHTNGLPQAEIAIRHALYWPDGTRKMSSKSNPKLETVSLLAQALLDKYNEDHLLFGDLAYELDDVVSFREIYEREGRLVNMFYHINLTTKTKGDDGFQSGVDNVFFAEVTRIKGEDVQYVLSCFCMVEPNDNGQCYGCMRYGNVDLKHPVDVDKYKGGHSYRYSPCSGFDPRRDTPGPDVPAYIQDEEDRLAYEEATVRSMYEQN
ncbi:uncharacterized protein LOC119291340 isoform X2 [Triticum dicoccoides]|uniref:uncharacterized protein LOC119291340 isoform X2 n=1 Tax=Triticum dicoccoides TaxID=85692 RepID=UPI00188E9236|nr:uncharacterized protein LOC119291340 isoform X2 [Triticum dicoccoides]